MTKHRRSLRIVLALTLTAMAVGATSAPAEDSVTFLAAGDFSANAAAGAVLTSMGAQGSDLTLTVGDLSYGVAGQEQAWCDFVTAKFPPGYAFELLAGNHESNGQNGNINDFGACLPNQLPGLIGTYGKQYYVDVPRSQPLVRFIQISPSLGFPDGTYTYPAGGARYTWTARAIDGARTAGIPWVVVGMHKPCLTVGVYACDPGADLFNLLVDKKVDLVLSGHEHMYQRSKQLALAAGCPAVQPGSYNAACVADGDSALVKGAGLVTATVGTGGVGLREVNIADAELPYFVTASGSNQNPSHGYLKVSATETRLDATFVRTDGNLTDAFSITGGPPPPNQPPTAAFTSSCTGLTCTFIGTGSSDPDGTVTTHTWDFGDSGTGTGATTTRSYAAAGTYPVTLTVTDNAGTTSAPVTTSVTVTAPPPNQPPTAAFTSSCTGLTCTFNGTGSSDPDGTVTTHTWDFGDTSTGTGATTTRSYAAAGAYPVTLTVTDDAGATSAPVTTSVTVTAPAGPAVVARDEFDRTVAAGFGTAPVGGPWSAPSGSSVRDGSGAITLAGGNDKTVLLPGGSAPAVDLRTTLWADRPITGGGLQLNPIGRRVVSGTTTVGDYRALLKLSANGAVTAGLAFRPGSGAEVSLVPPSTVTGLSLAPGEKLAVRLLVTGASPTILQLKVWKAGTAEPTGWTRTATGSQAGMQVGGSTGLRAYLSSTVTDAPLTLRIDDWSATVPQ
ncbi:PKD domain-containing protein [Nakamurella deserti]|uniref:PKD domain-containing protein n=1 Tax=Nakamurella deserti TaxID=2164074 RepID=UPI0014794B35|nr:PKD domain-containing protein [Nakamurella deserti]